MTELLTAAQMRAIEGAAIGSGDVTGLELMERAGQGVVDAVFAEWPELEDGPRCAVVLCGPGNNGGDGFVVARLLTDAGWEVEVYLYGDAEKLPPDARVNYERWVESGSVLQLTDETDFFDDDNQPREDIGIYIDALFGIGLTRIVNGFSAVQDQLNQICITARKTRLRPFVVAVDIPSGLSSDTGGYPGYSHSDPLEDCLIANLTVTFHGKKIGHMRSHGPAACGVVKVVDIGV